ncbi:MAG: AAA family ATPase, partial [Chloroflexi bacterium]|nr:AAA family ATPase [Chloroflexota bacterium]
MPSQPRIPPSASLTSQSSLFPEAASGAQSTQHIPLATRMRPRSLEEIAGQQKLLAEGHILRRLIERDRLGSLILWGPPGSGKTTIAEVIALQTRARFIRLSATSDGVGELRRVIDAAQLYQRSTALPTIAFIDEIHRFTKVQQDALLPHIEQGTITLIGATTENPSFSLTPALLSRCRIVQLEPLSAADISLIISRTLADEERGLGSAHLTVSHEALDFLVQTASGDARAALNILEAAASGK